MTFDSERFLLEAARNFHAAKTLEDLDKAWIDLVRPVYGQLTESVLSLATQLYTLNQSVLTLRR